MSSSETSSKSTTLDEFDNMRTSGASGYSSSTNTTVKTARFSDEPFEFSNLMVESCTQTLRPKDRLLTDLIVVRHPRSIVILAAIELCLSIKIVVFGLICRFYDGCPYLTSIWIGLCFLLVSILGIVFVKYQPKRRVLLAYCACSSVCLCLTVALFGITAWLLDSEEDLIRQRGWDFLRQRIFELNRIVENTKIAMYALLMVLTPAYGVCCVGTTVLLCFNVSSPSSEELRGYYIANSPLGHQMVLVPVDVKTGAADDIHSYKTFQINHQPHATERVFITIGTQTL